jgi:hypothetical protein
VRRFSLEMQAEAIVRQVIVPKTVAMGLWEM